MWGRLVSGDRHRLVSRSRIARMRRGRDGQRRSQARVDVVRRPSGRRCRPAELVGAELAGAEVIRAEVIRSGAGRNVGRPGGDRWESWAAETRDGIAATGPRRPDGDRWARLRDTSPGRIRRQAGVGSRADRTSERRGRRRPRVAGESVRRRVIHCHSDERTAGSAVAARNRPAAARTAATAAAQARRHSSRRPQVRRASWGSHTSSGNPLVKRPGADRDRLRVRRGVQRIHPVCRSTPAASCGSLPKPVDLVRTRSTHRLRAYVWHCVSLVWWR